MATAQAGADRPGMAALREAILHGFAGRIAVVSSFGAESALLLAMVADIDRRVPVLFLDTGKHFPETLAYVRELAERLGLTDVRPIRPDAEALGRADPLGTLHRFIPDDCCDVRKVAPLARALAPFHAWITGRKRFQSRDRAALPIVEQDDGRTKLNPLADWTAAEIAGEMRRRGLPPHPLAASGYASIGCAPCTHPVAPGEDPRAGRWAGTGKTECGIHLRAVPPTRPAAHPADPCSPAF
jgi:phosphoadenosine phosphosulfate reductase